MKEFLVIAAVAVTVMLAGWGLDLGLGYAQTAWSPQVQHSWYASSSKQTTDQGYARQDSGQSLQNWYPASRTGFERVGYGRSRADSTPASSYRNRMGHGNYYYCGGMGWGYGSGTGNPANRH